jgi:hypothetical protein
MLSMLSLLPFAAWRDFEGFEKLSGASKQASKQEKIVGGSIGKHCQGVEPPRASMNIQSFMTGRNLESVVKK